MPTNEPTEKQMVFIRDLQEFGDAPEFKGTTRQDASRYIDDYKFMAADDWSLDHGYF